MIRDQEAGAAHLEIGGTIRSSAWQRAPSAQLPHGVSPVEPRDYGVGDPVLFVHPTNTHLSQDRDSEQRFKSWSGLVSIVELQSTLRDCVIPEALGRGLWSFYSACKSAASWGWGHHGHWEKRERRHPGMKQDLCFQPSYVHLQTHLSQPPIWTLSR